MSRRFPWLRARHSRITASVDESPNGVDELAFFTCSRDDPLRQVFDLDDAAAAEDKGVLDGVFQLADISRPMVP